MAPLPAKALVNRGLLTALAAMVCASASGCLTRTLQVRSTPPGAAVYIGGEEVGVTPYDHEFHTYGTLDVELRKPGYRAAHVEKRLPIPWYEHFPLDFVSEFLVPWPIHDEHELAVELERYPPDRGAEQTVLDRDERAAIGDRIRALRESLSSDDS